MGHHRLARLGKAPDGLADLLRLGEPVGRVAQPDQQPGHPVVPGRPVQSLDQLAQLHRLPTQQLAQREPRRLLDHRLLEVQLQQDAPRHVDLAPPRQGGDRGGQPGQDQEGQRADGGEQADDPAHASPFPRVGIAPIILGHPPVDPWNGAWP